MEKALRHADIPMAVKALKAGAVEFLTKPFREQELLDAVRIALDGDRRRRYREQSEHDLHSRFDSLSHREREVMLLVTVGMMNKQVGAKLGIGEVTVKVHRHKVMHKLGAQSFAELVRMADRLGLPQKLEKNGGMKQLDNYQNTAMRQLRRSNTLSTSQWAPIKKSERLDVRALGPGT